MTKYWEDFPVGFRYESDPWEMTGDEIMDFARKWDPQPFHIDPEAAKDGPFGGIIASGWHTLVTAFERWYASGLWAEASMGSPGMTDVKWMVPVRPGDWLRVVATVTESTASRSRPDRGRITVLSEIYNQDGQKVAEYSGINILRRRP